MSKLYKDLKYDTDWVMQPGDPLTSSDGSTAIKAVNAGKGFIETYGDVIDHYYDVTVDIPQVSGASARIRLKDVDETSIGVEILSIEGFPGAEIDNNSSSHIKLNGASWGYVHCNPAWEGSTYPDYAIIPIGFGGRICVDVGPISANSEYCHWSDLEQTRQLVSSKEISTTDQLPSLPLSVANGGTGVDGSSQSANKVLASPSSGSGAVSFRSLVAADIPNLNTSKLTEGVLGVARGGTGKSSHTANSVIIAGTSTIGAFQNVASESGALYSTGANAKPQFGTLPVAQGGTGATTAANALTNLGAAGADHTHASLVSSANTAHATLTMDDDGNLYAETTGNGGGALQAPAPREGEDAAARGVNSSWTIPKVVGQYSYSAFPANKVLAGPTAGSTGMVSFRSLVAADIPTLSTSKISGLGDAATKNVGTASGTVAAGNHTHPEIEECAEAAVKYSLLTTQLSLSTVSAPNDTAEATLVDHAINIVELPASVETVTFTFPTLIQGKARDFMIRLTIVGEVPTIYFQEAGGGSITFDADGETWTSIQPGANLIMFTETKQAQA